jgi:glutamine amidotransferase
VRRVHLLTFGSGNIGSLTRSLKRVGYFVTTVSSDAIRSSPEVLFIPGVGSACFALQQLRESGLDEALIERVQAGLPTVGICLGAQLFFDFLPEADAPGLGLLEGDVAPLDTQKGFNNGWCHLDYEALKKLGLSRSIRSTHSFYFNHQYKFASPKGLKSVQVKELRDIPALYVRDNLVGIQFHPEKSQGVGETLIRNIMEDHFGL